MWKGCACGVRMCGNVDGGRARFLYFRPEERVVRVEDLALPGLQREPHDGLALRRARRRLRRRHLRRLRRRRSRRRLGRLGRLLFGRRLRRSGKGGGDGGQVVRALPISAGTVHIIVTQIDRVANA